MSEALWEFGEGELWRRRAPGGVGGRAGAPAELAIGGPIEVEVEDDVAGLGRPGVRWRPAEVRALLDNGKFAACVDGDEDFVEECVPRGSRPGRLSLCTSCTALIQSCKAGAKMAEILGDCISEFAPRIVATLRDRTPQVANVTPSNSRRFPRAFRTAVRLCAAMHSMLCLFSKLHVPEVCLDYTYGYTTRQCSGHFHEDVTDVRARPH